MEVKGGKAGLSEAQRDWVEAFSDIYEVLMLRAKFDESEYLKDKKYYSIEGAILDRCTGNVETLDNLREVESDTKSVSSMWGGR